MRLFTLLCISSLVALLVGLQNSGAAADTISKIVIQGNRRIETNAIQAKLSMRAGDKFSSAKVSDDIKTIYKMGYFEQIKADLEGTVLTYIVSEKPTIDQIVFQGNDALSDSKLRELMGTKAYNVFDAQKINSDRKAILGAYEEKGYYLAEVNYELSAITSDNQTTLTLKISEGEMIKIKRITFLGNKNIPDEKLKKMIQTREKDILSWLTRFGNFQQTILDRDTQVLSYLYYTEGYVQARVSPPEVYVTPDKKWIYITISIDEGEQFSFGDIDIGGDMLFSKEELLALTKIKSGEGFSNEKVNHDVLAIGTKYKDEGYAFTNVIPMTSLDEEARKVNILFNIEKGDKVYVGEINFIANTKTRDKVLRREMDMQEGELYNETKIQRGLADIRRLGFFADVTINKPQGRAKNIVDLEITVEERPTGTLNVGAGYSSTDKFVLTAQVSEENFLGFGHQLSLDVNVSQTSQRYNISYRYPYFLDTDWEAGADLFRTTRTLTDREEGRNGFDVLLGHPIPFIDYTKAYFTYKLEDVSLKARGTGNVLPVEGSIQGVTSGVTNTVIRDYRDNRLDARSGSFQSASFEYAGLGGDRYFMKGIFENRMYFPLPFSTVLKFRTTYGSAWRIGTRSIPVDERFLLGGVNSLRGFDSGTVGSIDSAGRRVGGKEMIMLNAEYEIPILKDVGVRFVSFYDVGAAYTDWERIWTINDFEEDRIRQDFGFGLRWFSPLGPLRFEFGIPVDREPGEERVKFQFAIQPSF